MNQVVDFINVNRDRYVDELKQYLAIPSISALPEHAGDVRRAAEWTADSCRAAGLENVKLIETPGNPVVYGDWLHAPGKPTVLFYGHYDVQPVDPVNLWTSPPFEATVRDGEIYARGAADDKGQVFMHIKAIEAHLKKNGSLPINMKFFIEGEEEVGSAHLDEFVRGHKQELGADVVVISDSPMFDRGIPSICYGLRGLAYFQIDLRGTRSDLHSGSFGGAVANPAFVLAQVLAQMKDRSGRIKIPGFYDDVRPLSDAERAEWKKLPFNETKYRKELGAPRLFGETGQRRARTPGGMGLAAEGVRTHHRLPLTGRYRGELLASALRYSDEATGCLVDEGNAAGDIKRYTRRLWPQTEIAKAWIAQAEAGEAGAADEARAALARLERHYLSHPVTGGWYDQFDRDGNSLVATIPASSFYHVLCAVAEAEQVIG